MKLDFIGIGVSRSGTTWTWDQLVKHPQICSPNKKEFGLLFKKRPNEFTNERVDKCDEKKFIGEYHPAYFYMPKMVKKISEHFPTAQIFLILRNPIERIFTQYKVMQWKHHKAIAENFMDWFIRCKSSNYNNFVRSNQYMKWLPLWDNAFKDKLLVNFYDEIKSDSLGYIQKVFKHIGIRQNFVPPDYLVREQKPYNRFYDNMPIEMSSKDKRYIKNYYKKTIIGIQEHLGKETNWLD